MCVWSGIVSCVCFVCACCCLGGKERDIVASRTLSLVAADIMFSMDAREKAKKEGREVTVGSLSEMWKALTEAEREVRAVCLVWSGVSVSAVSLSLPAVISTGRCRCWSSTYTWYARAQPYQVRYAVEKELAAKRMSAYKQAHGDAVERGGDEGDRDGDAGDLNPAPSVDDIVTLDAATEDEAPKKEHKKKKKHHREHKVAKHPTRHTPQPTAHSPQPTAHSPQPTAHSPQPTAHSPQPTPCTHTTRPHR
jgi:hypothetical protein